MTGIPVDENSLERRGQALMDRLAAVESLARALAERVAALEREAVLTLGRARGCDNL